MLLAKPLVPDDGPGGLCKNKTMEAKKINPGEALFPKAAGRIGFRHHKSKPFSIKD